MTKLLNKSLKAYVYYSLIILVVSIPVYVFVVDYIWITELDKNNWLTLQHIKDKLQSMDFSDTEIEYVNYILGELQPGVSIIKAENPRFFPDEVYEAIRANNYDPNDDSDRFRGLKSHIEINGEHYILFIETNIEEIDETLIGVAIVTFLFFVILITGFILLNRRIEAKTWKPFYQTLQSLHSFELSDEQQLDLPETDIQEFQKLNKSLNRLVKNNVDTYRQQKAFTENASHELQTPIALLKSKFDLLIQQKNIPPQISDILNSIEAPLSRLSRINKNLLVLAKVENQQYNQQEKLDVKELIEASLLLFDDYISNKGLSIYYDAGESITVVTNLFLLETLINNLLSNAIRHTDHNGSIQIKSENRTICISNSGNNTLDKSKLFKRFVTTSKTKVSSGLGLSIIKEIAIKYNWQVEYSFDNGMHTFSVSF